MWKFQVPRESRIELHSDSQQLQQYFFWHEAQNSEKCYSKRKFTNLRTILNKKIKKYQKSKVKFIRKQNKTRHFQSYGKIFFKFCQKAHKTKG